MFGKLFYQVQVFLFGHHSAIEANHYPTMAEVVRPLAHVETATAIDAR